MTFDDEADRAVRSFVFVDGNQTIEDPRRLEQLRRSGLLIARHRDALDVITHLAAQIAEAPAAKLSIIEVDRQIIPSFYGPEGQQEEPHETPISRSFCQYVVMNDAPLVVGDARTHPVLSSNPHVLEGTLVAYAGFPVHAPDGEVLGALSVMDVIPRTWTPSHLSGLKDLATTVDTKIALRLSRRDLHNDHESLIHILDGATHTMIVIADRDWVIHTMNHAAEDALAPVIDHVASRTLTDLVGTMFSSDLATGPDGAQDWTLLQPDGERRIFSVRVSTLHDPEGEVTGHVFVGDDVSARRKTEELLRESVRNQAEEVERLKALDAQRRTFIATGGHELRTPLTSILGYAELLAEGACGDLTPPQQDLVSRLVRNGRRLQHLTEDLLSLSLSSVEGPDVELVRTDIDVNRLTEAAWDSLQAHLAARDLRMAMDMTPDMPNVFGDLQQLERALLNLLTNAVKFTPDGGSVRLSVQSDPQGASFEVSDTGIGIPEDDQKAVFEPFFRSLHATSNAVQGAGIGLAAVRRIVESHGGEIVLTSVVGQGTTVRFTVPASDTNLHVAKRSGRNRVEIAVATPDTPETPAPLESQTPAALSRREVQQRWNSTERVHDGS